MNDKECKVKFFLDKTFTVNEGIIGIHPNDNTATVFVKTNDLIDIIKEHEKQISNHQLIITTHESMIASSLNLKNVMWIKEEKTETLRDLDEDDSLYFLKSPSNNLLQYILSEKVILVI